MTYVRTDGHKISGQPEHRIAHDQTVSGHSIVAEWHADENVLEARSDRLGLIPIFYWHSGSTLVLSDSLAELVSQMRNPVFDDEAVATFLQLGYYIGDSTPISGVKVLPPDARLTLDGTLSLTIAERSCQPPFLGTTDDAIDLFASLFTAAIAARAPLGFGRLPLSGGRDSRHILLELIRQGYRPSALVTQDRPVNDDLEIAALIAKRAGLPHIAVRPFRNSIRDELVKNRWNHYLTDENSWYVQISEHLNGAVFDGLAADTLSGSADQFPVGILSPVLQRGDASAGADALLDAMGNQTGYLGTKLASRWSAAVAHESIKREVSRHADCPNPLKSFLFWNRTRREISLLPITMASRVSPIYLPYLDPALVAFLLSLPYQKFCGHEFHDAIISRTYPSFADIPFAARRKRKRDRASAFRTSVAMARYARGQLSIRQCARSTAYAVATGNNASLAWFFSILPVLQLSAELGIQVQ